MAAQPKMRKRAMSWNVFERKYRPTTHSGVLTRNYDELDPKYSDPYHVWSAVDGDTGDKQYLLPGYHVVNVFGYVQTELPWTDEDDASGLSVLY